MVDELNRMIDGAEQRRAADYRFLRDLRDLARRYEWPWRRRIMFDDFSDGDFTRGVPWQVAEGRFWVDYSAGLRSTVGGDGGQGYGQPRPQDETPTSRPAPSGDQGLSSDFLRIIMEELGRGRAQESGTATGAPTRPAPQRAEIFTTGIIPGAFAIDMVMNSRSRRGQFEVGTFQGGDRRSGYRLIYTPGGRYRMELLRVSGRSINVVQLYTDDLNLDDGRDRRIQWTRDREGNMKVLVDGAVVMDTFDRGFTGGFGGFTLVNGGGDYALRSIAVYGIDN